MTSRRIFTALSVLLVMLVGCAGRYDSGSGTDRFPLRTPGSSTSSRDGGLSCNCIGRSCGLDACGDSCGECFDSLTCSPTGQCACEPNCTGKRCGDDGCGGSCGTCPTGRTCSLGG